MPEGWVQVSREHLRAAEILLKEGLYHLVCFHAQRAAAHSLQAMLEKNGIPPHGGTLLELLGACEACDRSAAALRGSCALLDLYLTGDPDAPIPGMLPWGPPTYEQAEGTIEAARQIVMVIGRLSSPFALTAVA